MKNTYTEIRSDLVYCADKFEEEGITYSAYNSGIQYNAEDLNGIIQTYYPSTGRIVFHRSNGREDNATYSIEDSNLETFIKYLKKPEAIQDLFC